MSEDFEISATLIMHLLFTIAPLLFVFGGKWLKGGVAHRVAGKIIIAFEFVAIALPALVIFSLLANDECRYAATACSLIFGGLIITAPIISWLGAVIAGIYLYYRKKFPQ